MPELFQDTLPKITHGHHCCLLFSTPKDQIEVTVPFLALGLERDERSIYVGDPQSIEQIRVGLKGAGLNIGHEESKGRLVLSSDRDYLDEGRFKPQKMLAFLQQAYDSTMNSGFTALRAAGDVSWEVGPAQDYRDLVYYESLLDIFFLGKKMVGMCQYPHERCPSETLSGILNTHKVAALNQEICSNFHYLPPELLQEKDERIREKRRLQWMNSQLLQVRRAEIAYEKAMQDLLREKRELERVNLELDSFIYIANHDLKLPLRTMSLFSGLINSKYKSILPAEVQIYLEKIIGSAEKLYKLIEDLLTFSRASRLSAAFEKVQSGDLVKQALSRLQHLMRQSLKIMVAQDMPEIACDKSKIKEVFVNLIGNAIKFSSRKSEPQIEVGWADAGDAIEFYVKDNGVGIEPEHCAKIFEMFKRVYSADDYEGTGIGLYLVKKIVEHHRGKIWVDSEFGAGSTFKFRIPKNLDQQPPETEPETGLLQ